MFRLLFSIILIAAAGFLFFYFAPTDIKQKGAEFITKNEIVPEPIRETASNILYTSAEQREQLIAELENQLQALETATIEPEKINPTKVQELIKKSEDLLTKIKAKNTDNPNIANLAAEKLLNLNSGKEVVCPDNRSEPAN